MDAVCLIDELFLECHCIGDKCVVLAKGVSSFRILMINTWSFLLLSETLEFFCISGGNR